MYVCVCWCGTETGKWLHFWCIAHFPEKNCVNSICDTAIRTFTQNKRIPEVICFNFKSRSAFWGRTLIINSVLSKTTMYIQTCQPLEIQTCILKPTNLYFSVKTCIFLKHAQTGFLYLIFRHENRLKKKKSWNEI